MTVGLFTEFPSPEPNRRGLFSVTAGYRFDSIIVRVSFGTFATPQFTRWVSEVLLTRLHIPNGRINIEIS